MRSLERAVRLGLIALPALGLAGQAIASEELAKKHACLACHAVDQKVLGPSFREVAARYAKTPAAAEMVARHIRNGIKGAWGDMPMPPQPQLSEAEASTLAAWVLAAGR